MKNKLLIIPKSKKMINKVNTFTLGSNKKKLILKKKSFFKLKKKWRHWRSFKQYYINIKKITFFKKIKWSYNNRRVILHQLTKSYLSKINGPLFKYTKKLGFVKFYFFLKQLELRLNILLLRSRFFFKLINCNNAIKLNLILVNGVIINKIYFLLQPLDLFQRRRLKKKFYVKKLCKRFLRLKWRKHRWKQARFIFWKIRRASHFNLYWVKKQNTILNYLEINYKIPAAIVIKQPFLKELFLNKQRKMLNSTMLKKIFFLY